MALSSLSLPSAGAGIRLAESHLVSHWGNEVGVVQDITQALQTSGLDSGECCAAYLRLAKESDRLARVVATSFPKLELGDPSPEQRLLFCRRLAAQGDDNYLLLLSDQLGFVELIKALPDRQQRFERFQEIATADWWLAIGLLKRFEELDLGDHDPVARVANLAILATAHRETARVISGRLKVVVPQGARPSDYLGLCKAIIARNVIDAGRLMPHSEFLHLGECSLAERLDFCEWLLQTSDPDAPQWHQEAAAGSLAFYFHHIVKDDFSWEQRLSLIHRLAAREAWAGSGLAENFQNLGLERLNLAERKALILKIASHKDSASRAVIENLPSLGLAALRGETRIAFLKQLVEGSKDTAQEAVKNFSKLGLEGCSLEQKLGFTYFLAEQGAAATVARNFDDLDLGTLPDSERQALATFLVDQGEWSRVAENWARFNLGPISLDFAHLMARTKLGADVLFRNVDSLSFRHLSYAARVEFFKIHGHHLFCDTAKTRIDAFGFMDDITACPTIEEKLERCKELFSIQYWMKGAILYNLDRLPLVSAPLEERMQFSKELSTETPDEHRAAAEAFVQLGFIQAIKNAPTREKALALTLQIAETAAFCASGLIQHFDELGLVETDSATLKAFFSKVAQQGGQACISLCEYAGKLPLHWLTVNERLALARELATQGEAAANKLLCHFEDFQLDDGTSEERLQLCKEIALQGQYPARDLAHGFDRWGLESSPAIDRLDLVRVMTAQGEHAGYAVLYNWEKFKLDELSIVDRLALFRLAIQQGGYSARQFANRCKNLGYWEMPAPQRWQLAHLLALTHRRAALDLAIDTHESQKVEPAQKERLLLEYLHPHSRFLMDEEIRALEAKSFAPNLLPITHLFATLQPDSPAVASFLAYGKDHPARKQALQALAMEDTELGMRLFQWSAYATGMLTAEQLGDSDILQVIYLTRCPVMRYDLLRQMSFLHKDDILRTDDLEYRREKLGWILLARLVQEGFSVDWAEATLKLINRTSYFKDSQRLNCLLSYLLMLVDNAPYHDKDMLSLQCSVTTVLTPKSGLTRRQNNHRIIQELNSLSNLFGISGREKFLAAVSADDYDPERCFEELFSQLFHIGDLPHFTQAYERTFGQFRDKLAIFSYLRAIKGLPKEQELRMKEGLNHYVRSVLTGDFRLRRYDPELSPHLKTLFSSRADLQALWCHTADPQPLVVSGAGTPDYRNLVHSKIVRDGHLPHTEQYPELINYLQGDGGAKERVADGGIEQLLIQLIEGTRSAPSAVRRIRNLGIPLGEFDNDLEALLPKVTDRALCISESDDPCDLLLLGTEIASSCQRVTGSPKRNKGLLSYLINGELRPIVVKDRSGRLVARSLMRLVWDADKKQGVIVLERCYSNVSECSVKEAIVDWAIAKAQRMGVALVSNEVGHGAPYQGELSCDTGAAPFTYSDAAGGIREGAFTISDCHILYVKQ